MRGCFAWVKVSLSSLLLALACSEDEGGTVGPFQGGAGGAGSSGGTDPGGAPGSNGGSDGARGGRGGSPGASGEGGSLSGSGGAGARGGSAGEGQSGGEGNAAGATVGAGAGGENEGGAAGDSSGSSDLDPATCPVGIADGCCGLLVNGGSDPDCPSLDCAAPSLSTPILLPDPQDFVANKPGVGLAWTGKELVTARLNYSEVQEVPGSSYDLVIEWRDSDGEIVKGPVTHSMCTGCAAPNGPAALAFEPTTRTFLFVYARGVSPGSYRMVAFDEAGTVLWNAGQAQFCNGETSRLQVFAAGGRFVVATDYYTCDLPGDRHSQINIFDPAGNALLNQNIATPAYDGAYACNADCSQIFGYYNDGPRYGALLDVTYGSPVTIQLTNKIALGGSLYGGVTLTAAAFDGSKHLVLSGNYLQGGVYASFRFFDAATKDWSGGESTSGTGKGLPGTMVWTGSGFMAAAATFAASEIYAFPGDRRDISIQTWNVSASGAVLNSEYLEGHAGIYPQLAWAGGPVAVSWVRTLDTQIQERYLAFYRCAE